MIYRRLALRDPREAVIAYTVVDEHYQTHGLADAWLYDLRFGQDLSLNTVAKYAADLAHFLAWACSRGLDVHNAPGRLTDYQYLLRTEVLPQGQRGAGRPRQPGRGNAMLGAVRTFYDWAVDADHVDKRVERQLWRHKGKDREARHRFRAIRVDNPLTVSDADLVKIVQEAGNVRDRFMIVFLRYTGTRVGQLLGLRLQDLHLRADNRIFPSADGQAGSCPVTGPHVHRIRREDNPNGALSKARHQDYVPVPPVVVEAYLRYLPWRDALPGASQTSMVFLNQHGHALGRSYPNGLLRRLAHKAGVDHCTPHLFRHTFATDLREQGTELDTLQRILGHRSAKSVEAYNHIPDRAMRDAVEQVPHLTEGAP